MTYFHKFHTEIFFLDRFDTGSDRIDRSDKLTIQNYGYDDRENNYNFGNQKEIDLIVDQVQREDDECNMNERNEEDIFSSQSHREIPNFSMRLYRAALLSPSDFAAFEILF